MSSCIHRIRYAAVLAAAVVAGACGGNERPGTSSSGGPVSLPDPLELVLPVPATASRDEWLEPYVGKAVRIAAELTIADLYNLERTGEILLLAGGRAIQPTNAGSPGASESNAASADFRRRSILLDDGSRGSWVKPVRFYRATNGENGRIPVRAGDRVSGLTGILEYSPATAEGGVADFRLVPTKSPDFIRTVAHAPLDAPGEGTLRVLSVNALNLFSTPRSGGNRCGPNLLACRGADTLVEYHRQLEKLSATIALSNAHIVGLMEIENDEGRTLTDLVAGLNARDGRDWRHVHTGMIGGDAIRVAIIYDAGMVLPVGVHRVLSTDVDPAFIDNKNRPSLAQAFRAEGGEVLTVVVNHFKSKGSDCDDIGDPDTGDGQGNCNGTRTRAAEALARWLGQHSPPGADSDVLIIGDLNAYLEEDPVRALESAGYVNLVERSVGAGAYTYLFRGRAGVLDHALASPSLAARVKSTRIWHINADESPLRDYNLDNDRDPTLFEPDLPFRSSDHDPVITDIRATESANR